PPLYRHRSFPLCLVSCPPLYLHRLPPPTPTRNYLGMPPPTPTRNYLGSPYPIKELLRHAPPPQQEIT
ncbi:predicted protein, partial [Nematostella vectensis]